MTSGVLWGRSVLVVDDDEFTRSLVVLMMRKLKALQVWEAADGEEAVQLLKKPTGMDCILCDLNMPRMNGLQLLKAVRTGATGADTKVPFAVLTGHCDTEYISLAIDLDVDCFMAKPVTVEMLAERFGRILIDQDTDLSDRYRGVEVPTAALDGVLSPADELPETGTDDNEEIITTEHASRCPLMRIPVNSVLARDLMLSNGVRLLAEGQILKAKLLFRLRDLSEIDPAVKHLWIKR